MACQHTFLSQNRLNIQNQLYSTYTWYKSVNLTIYGHFKFTLFSFFSRLSIVNTEDGHSIFTLNPAAPSDAGLYKVVARNPLGQVTATIRVVLGDICGSPDSPSVEAMTDTDILLSWKTPSQLNHAPVIAYKVQMGYIGEFALLHIMLIF